MTIDPQMTYALNHYLEHIKADYAGERPRVATVSDSWHEKMVVEFNAGISYEIHRKFAKIITGRATGNTSVHSFVMLEDDGKFKRGDILKAATWRAPAKNFARGNVLDLTLDRVRWTGAH